MKNYRIPRRVNLGGGYVVKVVFVSPLNLVQLYTEHVDQAPEPAELCGFCDEENFTIYMNSRLPKWKKWETYWHELQHILVDIKDIHLAQNTGQA